MQIITRIVTQDYWPFSKIISVFRNNNYSLPLEHVLLLLLLLSQAQLKKDQVGKNLTAK